MALATNKRPRVSVEKAREELRKRKARQNMLDFVDYCWSAPDPFIVGLHTRIICARLDKAIEDFEKGISSFIVAMMPVRHGKSEVISRNLPPYFLGRCAKKEPGVISTGYGSDLVEGFSRRAKAILRSDGYRNLFPNVRMCDDKRSDKCWQVEYQRDGIWRTSHNEINVAGLLGAITGKGYELGLIDDFCKGREDAESPRIRDKTWDAFKDNFLTRRSPLASITILTATPWNIDDLVGRIKKEAKEDPFFPQFEFYVFPAQGPGNANGEVIHYDQPYLFLERFPKLWYQQQFATLGKYSAAGLMNCNPQMHSGNLFDISDVKIHEDINDFPNDTQYVRFWDLASTDKELLSDDPDYTAGALCCVTHQGVMPHFWVKDIVAGQWSAGKRQEKILVTTERDTGEVKVLVEQIGGYKDAVDLLKKILKGKREVVGVPVSVNKVVRGQALMPVFEAGNVHILKADWNKMFFEHVGPFPSGLHDDVADAIIGAYRYFDTPDEGYCRWSKFDVMPN